MLVALIALATRLLGAAGAGGITAGGTKRNQLKLLT